METPTPILTLHRASERGGGEHGWLSTRHSFSFADWYEPTRMGFCTLRVLNDDVITVGHGFGTHGHANMEIITVVTQGVLAHADSLGSEGRLVPGEVQVMSAGTGVRHSEYNGGDAELRLFQIWIMPDTENVTPRYDQRSFDIRPGETLLVAPMGHPGALNMHQDAYISRISLKKERHAYQLKKAGHGVYFFIIEGAVTIAGEELGRRDALGVEQADSVLLSAEGTADVLAIEVPQ